MRLFSSKGFEQTSLREVADAVGITKASLYYHYASKLDLLLAIIEPIVDDLSMVAEAAERTPHSPEGVREVLNAQLQVLLRHRAAGAMVVGDTVAIINAMGDRYPDLMDVRRRLCRWLAGPDPSDEALLRANASLEALGTVLWTKPLVPDAGDELIERVLLDAALSVLAGAGRAHHG